MSHNGGNVEAGVIVFITLLIVLAVVFLSALIYNTGYLAGGIDVCHELGMVLDKTQLHYTCKVP